MYCFLLLEMEKDLHPHTAMSIQIIYMAHKYFGWFTISVTSQAYTDEFPECMQQWTKDAPQTIDIRAGDCSTLWKSSVAGDCILYRVHALLPRQRFLRSVHDETLSLIYLNRRTRPLPDRRSVLFYLVYGPGTSQKMKCCSSGNSFSLWGPNPVWQGHPSTGYKGRKNIIS